MELKKGKWYKFQDDLMLITGDSEYAPDAIGFEDGDLWCETFGVVYVDRPARRKEIQKALSKEAVKRGFKGSFSFSKKKNELIWFKVGSFGVEQFVIFDDSGWKYLERAATERKGSLKDTLEIKPMSEGFTLAAARVDTVNYVVDFSRTNKATFSFNVYNAKNGA